MTHYCMCIKHQYSVHHAGINKAQCCVSCIRHQYGSMVWIGINIIMAQCCASGINMVVHWYHASIRLDAVHPQLNDVHQATIQLDAVHPQLNDVHQASIWLCIMHQYGLMLCIHGSMMSIRHQCGSNLCIMHQYGSVWLIAVQASIHGLMLCIRQIWLKPVAVHHVSVWLGAVHPWLKLCIIHQYFNTAWLITLNLHQIILSTSFFATLLAVNTCYKQSRKKWL